MKEKEMLKHLEYINNELVLKSQMQLDNFRLLNTIPNIYGKYFDHDNNLFQITLNNGKKILMSYYQVKASGVVTNLSKRIQIPPNKSYPEETFVFAVYPAGNKNCYILFSSNKAVSNKNNTSKSVWLRFYNIYYCLNCNKDIYDIALDKTNNEKYKVFFSTDINNLFNLKESKFWKLDNSHIKCIEKIFESSKRLIELREEKIIELNQNTNIGITKTNSFSNNVIENIEIENKKECINDLENNSILKEEIESRTEEQEFNKNYSMTNTELEELLGMDTSLYIRDSENEKIIDSYNRTRLNANKEIGILAEKKFYELINTDINFIKENLNIRSIESIEWINQIKEEFRPFDFVINKNIYIDVKGTCGERPYFEISNNEYDFRKETIDKGNRYFIVSLFKLSLNESKEPIDKKYIQFFDEKKLEEIDFEQKTKYIYNGDQ
ncbi:protein NO VEIN domain-containing protein [Malacoplasma muris]|uniref:protein NO VEIN domain-containing protein n=1 Tax=Malacoplasma muris TaxID=2119 RepID=UPI00398E461F